MMTSKICSALSCCVVIIIMMSPSLRSSSASSTGRQQQLNPNSVKRFTAYTKPLTLNPGEVTNKFHTLKIPQGPIVVYRFEADVVEKNSQGQYIPVPVSDAYLHHHVVGSSHKSYHHLNGKYSPMKSSKISKGIGFGAGTESRGTPQEFPYPYGFITSNGEDEWTANVHIFNTRYMTETDAHHCLECPCIPNENMFNKSKFGSMKCNIDLQYENNTSCYPEFYHGGLRCCEDDVYCLPKKYVADTYSNGNDTKTSTSASTYYLRYTIEYSDVVTSDNRPLYLAGCCDATGNMTSHGAVEYDIKVCDKNTHPGCVHTLTTIQTLNAGGYTVYDGGKAKKKNDTASRLNDNNNHTIELVYAVGHQHRGGLGIHMYDVKTNNLICSSIPTYGISPDKEIGNEKDYIVSMSTCTFNPPIKMKSNDLVKIVATYDNTQSHTGVMSLFYIAIADVIDNNDNDDDLPKTTTSITTSSSSSETTEQHSSSIDTMSSSSSSFLSFLTLESITINIVSYVVIGIIIVIAIFYAVRYTYNYRRGYTSIELSKPL